METRDPIVQALISLCDENGGYEKVAARAGVSAANLWQIVAGTKLPSGKPRGIGPRLRESISSAYPNWMELHYPSAKSKTIYPPHQVTTALSTIDALLDELPAEVRPVVEKEILDLVLARWRESKNAAKLLEQSRALPQETPS